MNSLTWIFLNYAREDHAQVEALYNHLSTAGFTPWMDTKDLVAGEQWEIAIKTAIRNSHLFLACLSRHSVDKRGYVEIERKDALEILESMEYTDIFLIPVRLEPCQPPDSLKRFQWVDLFAPDGLERLVMAIRESLKRRVTGIQPFSSQPEPVSRSQQSAMAAMAAMAIDVGFLRRGSSEYLLCLDSEAGFDIRTEEAKQRALDGVQGKISADRSRTDVFFCLRGDHMVERYDYDSIEQLLGLAGIHGWGENRYVVVDERIGYTGIKDYDHASLVQWFDGVLNGRATDVIEAKLEPGRPDPNRLSKAANRSLQRYHRFEDLNPGEEWRCCVPETSSRLAAFLRPLVAPKTYNGNLVIIVDSGDPASQIRFVKSSLSRYRKRNCLVMVHAVPSSSKLYSLCDERDLRLIECRGPFELRYFLLRLNILWP